MWAKPKRSYKKRANIFILVAALLALFFTQFTPLFPTPHAYAAEDNDKLSVNDQHARTELYALMACLESGNGQAVGSFSPTGISSSDISNHRIWASPDWGASVGYEISPQGDNGTAPGTMKCADIDYGAALGFLNDSKMASYNDFANYLFKQNGTGNWVLKNSGIGKDLHDLLQRDANKRKQPNGTTVFGPKERERRTLVSLSQCVTAASDPQFSDVKIGSDKQPYNWRSGVSSSTKIFVGNDWQSDGQLTCATLVSIINHDYPDALKNLPNGVTLDSLFGNPQALAVAAGGTAPGGQPGAANGVQNDTCDAGDFSLNWILCPIFDGVGAVSKWMFENLIQPLLKTDPICLDGSGATCDNTIYKVWSSFRIYGDIFLIIALLVIVFGESIGGGLIDAYTAKKILPRLLAAAVLINLSIYIVAFLVDITNVVGGGLGGLLTAPLQNNGAFTIQPSGVTQGAIGVFGVGGLIIGGFALGATGIVLLLVGLAITGAIALLGVFVTLIIRQSIIIALILIAPVAFALWCLPNTANWFKRWWDTLFQMLLVYPIIIIIFAVADIMSYLTAHNGQGGPLSSIISFMLLVIPLYLIPFTLRSSNRILGAVQGAMSSAGRQINAATGRRAIAGAGAEVGKNWEATKAGNRFQGGTATNRRGGLNRFLQGGTLATPSNVGFNPKKMRRRLEAARSAQTSALSAEADKNAAVRAIAGNDDLLAASLHGSGTEADARAYLQGIGQKGDELEQNVGSIRLARRQMGAANYEDFAAANLAGTGTGYREGPAEMFETINRVAGSDRARATRILASARGQAERAKRIDLAGSGFATSAESLSQLYSDKTTKEAVNEAVTDEVLKVKSAGEIGTARNNALKNMVGSLQRRTASAQKAIDEANSPAEKEVAEHNYKRVLAHTASLLDVAGSSSPENAEVIGGVLGQGIQGDEYVEQPVLHPDTQQPAVSPVTNKVITEHVKTGQKVKKTLASVLEEMRSDPEFQQYRREYGSARGAAAAQANTIPPEVGGNPDEV